MASTDVDVVIIGAGISGIGIACHLRDRFPERSIAIVERRDAVGGTWDLFRYPGIRCDSDMHTFGYSLRPWPRDEVITDGESIRRYVADTAAAFGVDGDIHFGQRVERASWSSDEGRWTVETIDEDTGESHRFTGRFLVGGTGYYDYDRPHAPSFPGVEQYEGRLVYPQFWPEDLDDRGKRVVVVGSGATAVTIVPSMAKTAEHVVMLQRSPTYILSLPSNDAISKALRRLLPDQLVANMARIRNLWLNLALYYVSQWFPRAMRRLLLGLVRRQIGSAVDMRHFSPAYGPWDQRLCVVPDGDFFESLRSGRASVRTDHIDTFTPTGIRLRSGEHLDADVVVSATGLNVRLFGGVDLEVDGQVVDPTRRLTYKSVMLDGVPNFAFVFGYINAPWTRKVDMVGAWLNRLFSHMDAHGRTVVTPQAPPGTASDEPYVELTAGYIQRALDRMPQQGARPPWRNTQNLPWDYASLHFGRIDDGHLRFETTPGVPRSRAGAAVSSRAS